MIELRQFLILTQLQFEEDFTVRIRFMCENYKQISSCKMYKDHERENRTQKNVLVESAVLDKEAEEKKLK